MIQAIPPDRADQSLRISVLPRRSCRSRPVTNALRMKAAGENVAVDGVSVTDDVSRCRFPTKGLRDLTSDPFGRWMRSNPETQDLAATVLAISAIHRAIGRRWSEPRTGPSTRCRQHDNAGTSSSPATEAAYALPYSWRL